MAKKPTYSGKWRGPRKDISSGKGQAAYDAAVERNRQAGVSKADIYAAAAAKQSQAKFKARAMQEKYAPASMAARKLELQQQRQQKRADLIRRTLAQDAAIKRGWGL